ncbi:glutaminase, partial [Mesorhizobium sp. M1A.F.Ca.IN.020.32.1.1]|uniref:glutaminase n=1 Tax=Mesorhizobium sp. M1A.F.Ca.IN.020.32.1.1 TaxID=2496763 RepID=UPI000FD5F9AF
MPEQQAPQDLQAIIDDIYRELTPRLGEGKVADYIPQLARLDSRRFGMAIVTTGGQIHRVGDADVPFSIQSISKVFTLTLALGKHGENIWHRVGREPSGSAFNSIVQLEHEGGKPRNPFINAGAITISDLIRAG